MLEHAVNGNVARAEITAMSDEKSTPPSGAAFLSGDDLHGRGAIGLTFSFLFIITGIITGVFGTSISPYMFFWQASEEVEEEIALSLSPDEKGQSALPRNFIRNMRIDTTVSMVSAELVQSFIIITTGSACAGARKCGTTV